MKEVVGLRKPHHALACRFRTMRSAASQQHVSRVKLRATVLDLDDVIGVDALTWIVRTFAVPILACVAAFAFDLIDERAPFA